MTKVEVNIQKIEAKDPAKTDLSIKFCGALSKYLSQMLTLLGSKSYFYYGRS